MSPVLQTLPRHTPAAARAKSRSAKTEELASGCSAFRVFRVEGLGVGFRLSGIRVQDLWICVRILLKICDMA